MRGTDPLTKVTDAHCHPTDLEHVQEVYNHVQLGGLASMGTIIDDQKKVLSLGEQRSWMNGELGKRDTVGPRVVSCFGGFIASLLHHCRQDVTSFFLD